MTRSTRIGSVTCARIAATSHLTVEHQCPTELNREIDLNVHDVHRGRHALSESLRNPTSFTARARARAKWLTEHVASVRRPHKPALDAVPAAALDAVSYEHPPAGLPFDAARMA